MNSSMEGSLFWEIANKIKEETALVWQKEDVYMDSVLRLEPNYQPAWADDDYIYSPINYCQHWLMLVIDINEGRI